MSVLLSLLGDASAERRPTRAQVVAALQTEVERCRDRLRQPCSEACKRAYREQERAARRLLGAVSPDQGRLL